MIREPFGKLDALSISGELCVPMVITKNANFNKTVYVGFVPGIIMKNIESENIEQCKLELHNFIVEKIKNMVSNNDTFPFFPSNEEIRKDYENVCSISFLKIKSKKRKQP